MNAFLSPFALFLDYTMTSVSRQDDVVCNTLGITDCDETRPYFIELFWLNFLENIL